MMKSQQHAPIHTSLVLLVAMCAALTIPATAQAAELYAGSYTATIHNTGTEVITENFTADCDLGPISTALGFSSWAGEMGLGGVDIVFDLGEPYVIDAIRTEHVFPNEWWGVGVVYFYMSDDGEEWTLLGADGVNEKGGWRTRRYQGTFEAQYIKLNVRPYPGGILLLINQVVLEVPPDFLPVSTIQIDGLLGARHFIWMESENADFISGYLPAPSDPCDPCSFDNVSGSRLALPRTPSFLAGDLFYTYGFTNYTFKSPANFDDATFYKYYGSNVEQGATDEGGHDISPNINVYLDGDYLGAVAPDSTESDPCKVQPAAWTEPFSLGALTAGGHSFTFTPRGFYNPIAYDGILITEGASSVILNDSVVDGDWVWRPAPYLDPNSGVIGGTTATATVTVEGPVDEGYIRVDDEVVETFTDPGVFEVPIAGMGDHTLEVETFAYPFDPCAYDPGVYDPCNPPVLRGRVLAGASFRFAGCTGDFLTGDLNEDCYVNLIDYSMVSNNWMLDNSDDPNECGSVDNPIPDGDADGDCIVNMQDAALLGWDWLNCNDPCGPCP